MKMLPVSVLQDSSRLKQKFAVVLNRDIVFETICEIVIFVLLHAIFRVFAVEVSY